MAVMAVSSHAQVNFLGPDGKAYADGEVMKIYPEIDEWDDLTFAAPKLQNTSASPVKVSFEVNLTQLPENTALSDCFSGACVNYDMLITRKSKEKTIEANSTISTEVEWNCYNFQTWEYAKGTCIVEFTLYVNGNKDKTVTVHYINGDTNGVNAVSLGAAKKQGTFALDGKRVGDNAKGLVVRNGKKLLVK